MSILTATLSDALVTTATATDALVTTATISDVAVTDVSPMFLLENTWPVLAEGDEKVNLEA
jgi:hypothetical protein